MFVGRGYFVNFLQFVLMLEKYIFTTKKNSYHNVQWESGIVYWRYHGFQHLHISRPNNEKLQFSRYTLHPHFSLLLSTYGSLRAGNFCIGYDESHLSMCIYALLLPLFRFLHYSSLSSSRLPTILRLFHRRKTSKHTHTRIFYSSGRNSTQNTCPYMNR